jgi:hypothetical protein
MPAFGSGWWVHKDYLLVDPLRFRVRLLPTCEVHSSPHSVRCEQSRVSRLRNERKYKYQPCDGDTGK